MDSTDAISGGSSEPPAGPPPLAPGLMAICAWCGHTISRPPGPILKLSHGICRPCKDVVLESMGLSKDAA